ncbi:MAG TPA: hypothetical protein DC049_14485, partial [Spirochaetia bacterium]|nr:hypothetical protein [Spirochaetia bacterium]
PKKILLLSGWQTINIGDIGHTPGTLRYLTEHIPHAHVTVCLHKTNDQVNGMLKRRFPSVDFIQGRITEDGSAEHPELQKAFDLADLVIQNSGMHYNQFWPINYGFIRACLKARKPFGLYGQSFDGFRDDQLNEARHLLGQAAFIYCRDSLSLAYLQRIGVSPQVLRFGPDGCFGIDVRDDQRADSFLRKNSLDEHSFMAVIPRTNTPKLHDAADALNPKEPTALQKDEDNKRSEKLRVIIEYFIRSTGGKVLLAPEVDKEIPHARRLLYDPLPEQIRAQVVHRSSFWNADEAVSIYSKARLLVAMEPHSCIMALAQGVPCIHYYTPAHGVKAEMFRDIGLGNWLINIDDHEPQAVLKEIDCITSNDQAAQAAAFTAMQKVHMMEKNMCEQIRTILDKQ